MDASLLDQFLLPDGAAEALRKQNRQLQSLGDGIAVSTAGFDTGVSYRFFIHSEYNKLKSKAAKYEKSNEIEMIEWHPDRYNKPTERVKDLGPDLLEFDEETGEAIGGRYAEAYKRWKAGVTSPGLPLSKWGVLSDGWVTTLAQHGVYSVEQFASMPRSKMDNFKDAEVREAFERAIEFVAMKEGRVQADKQAEEILELQKEKARQAQELEELKAQMKAFLNGGAEPKRRGRKAQIEETNENAA